MSEVTRTMAEWIDLDLQERKLRAEVRRLMAACNQPKPTPVVLASVRPTRPQAFTPPKVDQRPPAELPVNPTLEDIAKQLGVSPAELQQASGGMSLERLMQLLGVEDVNQLVEQLNMILSNAPKALTKFERLRVAVAKVRIAGRRVGQLLTLERAKAARAEALKKHQARAKARG